MRVTSILVACVALLAGACSRDNPSPRPATGNASHAAASGHEAAAENEPFGRLTVEDLAGRLERREAVAVFDNNSRERYEQGHIPGARWVAYDQVRASDLPSDRDTPLVFYCANEH